MRALGVAAVTGVVDPFHHIELLAGAQHHVRLAGGKGKVNACLFRAVPGAFAVVKIKGYPHPVAAGIFDGEEYRFARGRVGKRGARHEQKLVRGNIVFIKLGAVDVQVGAVTAIHKAAASVRADFPHRHTRPDPRCRDGDMRNIHAVFAKMAGDEAAELVVRHLADIADPQSKPRHGDGGVCGGAANIL